MWQVAFFTYISWSQRSTGFGCFTYFKITMDRYRLLFSDVSTYHQSKIQHQSGCILICLNRIRKQANTTQWEKKEVKLDRFTSAHLTTFPSTRDYLIKRASVNSQLVENHISLAFMFVSCINLRNLYHRLTQIWCLCLLLFLVFSEDVSVTCFMINSNKSLHCVAFCFFNVFCNTLCIFLPVFSVFPLRLFFCTNENVHIKTGGWSLALVAPK